MGNRIFIELIEDTVRNGILVPEISQDSRIGRVIAVGNGRKTKKTGIRIPIEGISVGDKVLLPQGMGAGFRWIDYNGQRFGSFIFDDLLGVLEDAS